jgi:hypothetical protein
MFVTILCAAMTTALPLFIIFHLYNIVRGDTTNESIKRGDYIDYYDKKLQMILNFKKKKEKQEKEAEKEKQKKTSKSKKVNLKVN